MLERIKDKKVKIGVALGGVTFNYSSITTKYYEGTIVDYDDNFVVFNDGSMIAIKFIQTIEII